MLGSIRLGELGALGEQLYRERHLVVEVDHLPVALAACVGGHQLTQLEAFLGLLHHLPRPALDDVEAIGFEVGERHAVVGGA